MTRIPALLLLAALLGLAACGTPPSPPAPPSPAASGAPSPSGDLLPLEVGYPALRIALPVFVAQEQGLFQKHGLAVTLKRFETAQPMIDALAGGQLQVAGYAALPISYAAQERSGVPFLYLTGMFEDEAHPFTFLIVKKDSPMKALADLAGKRIGILPTLAYKVWLESVLAAEGVPGVQIENVAPPLQGQALAGGKVDALFANDPVATTVVQKGVGRLLVEGALVPKHLGSPFLFGSFNVRQDWADAHPEELKRLRAALDEAVTRVMANPKEAKAAMAPYVAEEQREFVGFYADGLYRTTGEMKEADFQKMADEYAKRGLLKKALDMKGLAP